jgi:hypothetical protein
MVVNIFDIVKNVFTSTEPLSKEEVETHFDIFAFNTIMSHHKFGALLAYKVMKDVIPTSKWFVYQYYFNQMTKTKRAPFLDMKKIQEDEKMKEMVEAAKVLLPEYSKQKILEVMPFIRETLETVDIEKMKGGFQHGGKRTKIKEE